jgi:hypothetical protein
MFIPQANSCSSTVLVLPQLSSVFRSVDARSLVAVSIKKNAIVRRRSRNLRRFLCPLLIALSFSLISFSFEAVMLLFKIR